MSLSEDLIRRFFNPYVQLFLGAILVSASELLLKVGATSGSASTLFGLGALTSIWTWAGIVTYILSFASWLFVLRYLPLGLAFALVNAVHVMVPLGAWLFLGETVSLKRWMGIALVLCGILLVAHKVATVEDKVEAKM